jgi:membrane-associated phospholipid phosphatase
MHSDKLREINDHLRQRTPQFKRFLAYRFKKGERYGLAFTLAILAILLAVWIFLGIVDGVFDDRELVAFDLRMQEEVALLLTPEMTQVVIVITDLGGGRGTFIGAILVGLFLLFRRRWWALLGLVIATGGSGILMNVLKLSFQRIRPLEQVVPATGYSFPSGHAMAAAAFFGYIIYLAWHHVNNPALRILVIVVSALMIFLIGISRVLLNVHWSTDVIGGFLAGFMWLMASIFIIRLVERPPAPKEVP